MAPDAGLGQPALGGDQQVGAQHLRAGFQLLAGAAEGGRDPRPQLLDGRRRRDRRAGGWRRAVKRGAAADRRLRRSAVVEWPDHCVRHTEQSRNDDDRDPDRQWPPRPGTAGNADRGQRGGSGRMCMLLPPLGEMIIRCRLRPTVGMAGGPILPGRGATGADMVDAGDEAGQVRGERTVPQRQRLPVDQRAQALRKAVRIRHLGAVDQDRDDRDAAPEGNPYLLCDPVGGIVDTPLTTVVGPAQPAVTDEGQENVTAADGSAHVIGEIDARRNCVDVHEKLEHLLQFVARPARDVLSISSSITEKDPDSVGHGVILAGNRGLLGGQKGIQANRTTCQRA